MVTDVSTVGAIDLIDRSLSVPRFVSSLTGVCQQLTHCSDGFVGDADIEEL